MVDKTIEAILKNHGAYSSELELLLLRNLDQVVRAHIEKLEAENQKLRDALEYCSEKLMKGILGYEPQAMMLERIEQALEDK